MSRLTRIVTVLSLIVSIIAQDSIVTSSALQATGSVVPVLLINNGDDTLLASLIGQSDGVQTLVIQCAPAAISTNCEYSMPVTITAGPSTVHASNTYQGATLSVEYNCTITGYTTATCAYTAAYPSDGPTATNTGITTIITTITLEHMDFSFVPVTITAEAVITTGSSVSNNPASTSRSKASSSSSSSSSISAISPSTSSSVSRPPSSVSSGGITSAASSIPSSAIASSTVRAGSGQIVVPGCFAAGIIGLAALL